MGRLLRLLLLFVFIAVLVTALYAWVGSRNGTGPGIELVEVTRGSITEKALAVGRIEPRARFAVKSKVSGIVGRCLVEVGDRVETGDPLFELTPDATPQELLNVDHQLRSATTRFEKARTDFERSRSLHQQGLVATGELDTYREAYRLAETALEQARANRELTRSGKVTGGSTEVETTIRAPASGTVLSRVVDTGDPVVPLTSYQPGTDLATVADMGDLIFEGTVDEIDVGKIQVGLLCRIKVGALPEAQVTGLVARIAPQAHFSEGATRFDLEIELDPHPDLVLRAGYSANADVIIREKEDVLLLPERLVLFEEGGQEAYVEIPGAGPESEPERLQVELGLSDGLSVEILSGLTEGQQVVQRPPREIT